MEVLLWMKGPKLRWSCWGLNPSTYGAILGHLKDRHDLLEKIKGCIVDSRGDPIIDTKGGLFVVRCCGFQLLVAIVCGRFGPVWCSLVAVWCCFQLLFVYVDIDNEEEGKPVADYFGLTKDTPKVLGYTGEDTKKYILDKAVTLENIKEFGEAFLEDKLKAFYKSDPIPETNDGDVKIVVGNNFDDIVLDESKDVLLEIYAPWCGHCQSLEPTYNKLAKHLRSIESLIVAKMDGTTNEHPRAKADGYPTILFFPVGKKSADPIPVDADRTVVAFYKFIKKHASIPFKLQKPAPSPASSEDSLAKQGTKTSTSDKPVSSPTSSEDSLAKQDTKTSNARAMPKMQN
ncbi:hypothetical protein ACS0TY_022470 [Phlomoides rotata]